MNYQVSLILLLILILHVSIAVITWFDNRYRPLMKKFSKMENDSERLHSIGKKYEHLVDVPQEFLESPKLIVVKEAKKVELRLMIEACLVTVSGIIPSGVIALMYGL
jgi:heme/copper-type cytochrome/quinol oxidase subunit 2